jgi:ABC-type multidrug transport system ATPase subunit
MLLVSFLCLTHAPSSGKTTMLDLLANRVSSGEIQGEIRINGRPRGKAFHHYAAYVQQGLFVLSIPVLL